MLQLAALRMTCLLATTLLGLASIAAAQMQVQLEPVADTTLYENAQGSIANGAGEHFFSGLTLRDVKIRRALVRFDLSSIPGDMVIESASLRLEVTRFNGGPCTLTLHRVLSSWGEGSSDAGEPGGVGTASTPMDATWVHRFWPDVRWSAPGGDFDSVPSASVFNESTGFIEWTATARLLDDLESWRREPHTNYGWLIESVSPGFNSAHRFATREAAASASRPILTLTLVPACPICTSDFNCDGGVDGSDVERFFELWSAGSSVADVNSDGGIDGTDVEVFLVAWENSAC